MAKKTKINPEVAKRAALLIGILAIFAFIFWNDISSILKSQGLSLTGVDIIAVTQPNFISNDPFWNAQTFQFTAVANGGGKTGQAVLSPQDAQNYFGVTTQQTATIDVTLDDNSCSFPIYSQSYPVYQYTLEKKAAVYSGGYWKCQSSIANPSYSSQTYVQQYGSYMGTTPIQCSGSKCLAANEVVTGGCDSAWQKQIGVIYYLDPTTIYNFSMTVTETLANNSYSATLTQNVKSVSTPAFRADLLGSFQGSQSCPASPNVAVFVATSPSNAPLQYIDKSYAQSVVSNGYSIVDLSSALLQGTSYNTIVSQMQGSTPNTGQYCDISSTPSTTITNTFVSCTPTTPTTIPAFNLYLNAQSIGIHVPVGQPQIESITVDKIYAATKADALVKVTNIGETDAFDGTITCGSNSPAPFNTRTTINAGETVDIPVSLQYAGFIGQCTAEVHSVNSPGNSDTQTTTLTFYPFCAINAPSSAHQILFTQYGCGFNCPNYGNGVDVFDTSCGVMANYDRCLNENCSSQASYTGIHCVELGKWMTTNNYMDEVNDGNIQPFIPTLQAHQYFITSVNNQPVCQYVDEYGYSNGQPISSLTFDYSLGYPQAIETSASASQPSPPVPQITTTPPAGEALPAQEQQPVQQVTAAPAMDLTNYLIVGGLATLAIIGYVYLKRRK